MNDDAHTSSCHSTTRARGLSRCADAGVRVELIDPSALIAAAQRRDLVQRLEDALALLDAARGEVRVRLVADPEMSAAHERYAGVPGTTDVLTFDMGDEDDELQPDSGALDVDIWACVDEARRRAAELGHEPERELLLYCLHGVLHCLGFDDHDPAEHARMHAEEDRLLEAIGVGATYARHAGDGAEQGGARA